MSNRRRYGRKPFERSALCGSLAVLAAPAMAQPSPAVAPGSSTLSEIVVTATRRSEDVSKVPYNISVVGSDLIESRGLATFEDLTRQIPNLNLNAAGSRTVGAQRPVMRGLNASETNRQGAANEQAPVATYLGNVPAGDLFPIDDVERVEVLRGPQGTLYGAGALGGAIRIIPAEPELKRFTGSITGSVGSVSHSGDPDRSLAGVINVPLGETFAVRVSARRQHDAGFVDRHGVMVRQDGPLSAPILATPGDVAGSSAVFKTVEDANWGRNTSVRASLKWEPIEALKVVAAYNFAQFKGDGGPDDNPHFTGGPDPLDPRITYPALGKYDVVLRNEEPYRRKSQMGSLDVSYDAGFATLSSTTSYTTTRGFNAPDITYLYLNLPSSYQDYYVGNPRNPRFNGLSIYRDHKKVFTQEVRLVSSSGGAFDYVIGGYYQRERSTDDLPLLFPGQADYADATGGFFLTSPNGESVLLAGRDKFSDKALFGELTWHVTPRWQVTGGARIFWQKFRRSLDINLYTFGLPQVAEANASSIKGKTIFKINTSFEFAPGQNAYATFSQGFRRGGPNTFATTGVIREDAAFLTYKSDTVDNYEAGVKGRLGHGIRYTAAVFW
ncbi:MAG TPA: TonB-dependent receptor, partial [Phenylobacterium sp.]|nr:TonB-dependent receptor [Phenylobacterium sp.]